MEKITKVCNGCCYCVNVCDMKGKNIYHLCVQHMSSRWFDAIALTPICWRNTKESWEKFPSSAWMSVVYQRIIPDLGLFQQNKWSTMFDSTVFFFDFFLLSLCCILTTFHVYLSSMQLSSWTISSNYPTLSVFENISSFSAPSELFFFFLQRFYVLKANVFYQLRIN